MNIARNLLRVGHSTLRQLRNQLLTHHILVIFILRAIFQRIMQQGQVIGHIIHNQDHVCATSVQLIQHRGHVARSCFEADSAKVSFTKAAIASS